MADQDNNQDEARRKAEDAKRETARRESAKGGGKEGDLKFSNEPDPRSPEQQQDDIDAHNERAKEAQDEALEEVLAGYDPEKVGHRLYGGIDIVDTRNAQPRIAAPAVNDPNLAAKRQIAEENREFQPARREESQANRGDPTARAEVIARH